MLQLFKGAIICFHVFANLLASFAAILLSLLFQIPYPPIASIHTGLQTGMAEYQGAAWASSKGFLGIIQRRHPLLTLALAIPTVLALREVSMQTHLCSQHIHCNHHRHHHHHHHHRSSTSSSTTTTTIATITTTNTTTINRFLLVTLPTMLAEVQQCGLPMPSTHGVFPRSFHPSLRMPASPHIHVFATALPLLTPRCLTLLCHRWTLPQVFTTILAFIFLAIDITLDKRGL
jgi:hypothetical protein